MTTTRNILLATTGESPQVVTETLYALASEGRAWPQRIRLITTALGAGRARRGLIEEGHLDRLCTELGRPRPAFSAEDILVIPDADGNPVDDARSLQDHEALADFIMRCVRDCTADPGCTLHASLAGGRKTMTYYLGYAMSLFARPGDLLSHVLVSKGYESHRDFWYPSRQQARLAPRAGEPAEAGLLPADAKVTLALIPFVRLLDELPQVVREVGNRISFTFLVRLMNLGLEPGRVRLCIDLRGHRLRVGDVEQSLSADIPMAPIELAFYAMFARARAEGRHFKRPAKNAVDADMLLRYLQELMPMLGLQPCERAVDGLDELEDRNATAGLLDPRTLHALRGEEVTTELVETLRGKEPSTKVLSKRDIGIPASWFDQRLNLIREALGRHLPASLAKTLCPATAGKGTPYRIPVSPDAIAWIAADR